MKEPSKKSDSKPSPEDLLKEFRAYLHLVITAGQLKRSKQLESLPGSKMPAYCRALAEMPDNTLAQELASPVLAILESMNQATTIFQHCIEQEKVKDAAEQAELERVLEQVDLALAFILRQVAVYARMRAETTRCSDLLVDATRTLGIGNGLSAARWIQRYQKEFCDDDREEDGSVLPESFPDLFAWDAYERIDALDRLADDFPEHVATAARNMNAWPMLIHRHTDNRRRFKALAERLRLGADYPIDASEGARFRPDTPMVRYLDPLIFRLNTVHCWTKGKEYESPEKEKETLSHYWWQWPDQPPGDEVVETLGRLRKLPPLNKATAHEWAEKALVPLILATDAKDWKNCREPALQQIAGHRGVKSRATFKSRLLAAVLATLRRLARPA